MLNVIKVSIWALLMFFFRCSYCWMVRRDISDFSASPRWVSPATAQAFQVRLPPLAPAKFVHLVYEMPDIHLVVRCIECADLFKRNSLDDVRKLHGRELFTPP